MDAIFEIGRNELLEKTGVYGTNNKVGAPFFEALTDRTRGAMESGNREDALPLVEQITNTLRNTLNYDIIDKAAGNELTNTSAETTGDTTAVAVGSYNPSDEAIKQASLGFFTDPKRSTSIGTQRANFETELKSTRDRIQQIEKKIADGNAGPRDPKTLTILKKNFDDFVIKGQNNDLRAGLRDTVKHIAEELDIKPTVLNKAIKIAYKNSLSEERDAFDDIEMILDTIKRGSAHKEE